MSKFCTHCGHEISEEATVCMNCGCPVKLPKKKKVYPKVIRNSLRFTTMGVLPIMLSAGITPQGICLFRIICLLISQVLIGIGIYFGYRGYKENGLKIGLIFGGFYEFVLVIITLLQLT